MEFDLKPGLVLNETYRLLEIIGRGGMGEVWKAQHQRLPKHVAVKVLLDASLANETSFARFRREAEIASRLGHPGIVRVLDFNTLPGGIPYMVLELLDGENLRQRLRRGPLPLPDAIRVLRQVASALAVAHEQGIVHRDLKPENIFMVPEQGETGPTERAKVLDFGISKIQGSVTALTRDNDVLGTPVYMAPEQTAGRLAQIDGRADQFALAAIAYEVIGGKIAFGGQSVIEVLGKVLEGEPTPLGEIVPSIPDHVTDAIDRALSKKPHLRFDTITEFVEALAGGAKPPPQALETGAPVVRIRPSVTAEMATGPTQLLDSGHVSAVQVRPGPGSAAAPAETTGTEEPAPKRPTVLIALLIVSLLTAGVLTVLLLRNGKPRGTRTTAAPGKDAGLTVARAPGTPPPREAPPDAGDMTMGSGGMSSAPAGPAMPPDAVMKRPPRRPPRRVDSRPPSMRAMDVKSIPADVRTDLKRARQALGRGAYGQALNIARRSLITKPTQAAFVIMTKSYCGRRDLRMAKAMLRRLSSRQRKRVIAWCKGKGLDLSGR